MDSREQFQQWWEKFYEDEPREPWSVLYSPEHDYYLDCDIDAQYVAWRASRAALVVDIDWPEANDDYCMEGEDGISVKEADTER